MILLNNPVFIWWFKTHNLLFCPLCMICMIPEIHVFCWNMVHENFNWNCEIRITSWYIEPWDCEYWENNNVLITLIFPHLNKHLISCGSRGMITTLAFRHCAESPDVIILKHFSIVLVQKIKMLQDYWRVLLENYGWCYLYQHAWKNFMLQFFEKFKFSSP